ncbi:lipoprotein BA_5634 family protein [Bacillus toyonensis]|uniref:lipoprotein BA_5634 family protein n=1 Tax=Bacillus toyonensis TaxID=155322 RepID=UPI003D22BDF0
MKKMVFFCSILLIIGAGYCFYQALPNILIVSGDQQQVEKVTEEYKSKLVSSTHYKEKILCQGNEKRLCNNSTNLRVLNKTTAEKLIKEEMLQKLTGPRVTEPIHSLPTVTKEKGLVYGQDISDEAIKIGNHVIPVTKVEGELGIGVGQGQKIQSKLMIVDDSIYKDLLLQENTFSVLRFDIKNILMGNIPDIGAVEKTYPEVETIRVKANKKINY